MESVIVTTYREIKLKGGRIIPANTEVEVSFLEKDSDTNISIANRDRLCNIRHNGLTSLVRIISVFERPDMETLEEWNNDAVCETPLGNRTEPDGYDEFGAPSWLMVLGFM